MNEDGDQRQRTRDPVDHRSFVTGMTAVFNTGGKLVLGIIQEWFKKNELLLMDMGIRTRVSEPSQGFSKNGISAELISDKYEALVQLWETGESDFHVALQDASSDVEVTHYEFRNKDEMQAALVQLISQMSEREAE